MDNTVKTLVLMQLGDKLDVSVFSNRKKLLIAIAVKALIIALITVAIYFVMSFIQSYMQVTITGSLLVFVIMILQILGLITCTMGLLKTLYQSKDNALLLSYPAKHNQVFISKLIVYYLLQVLQNITFLFPFMLAFGVFNSAGIHWSYYINIVLFTLMLPLICVLISALLSLPVMFAADFLKGKTIVSSLLLIGAVALLFYIIISFISSLPANLELIAYYKRMLRTFFGFIDKFTSYGLYLVCVGNVLMVKSVALNYLIIIGVIIGLFAAVYFLTMPFYFKIASHAIEIASVKHKTKMKVHKTTFGTFLNKEFKMVLRDSNTMVSNFIFLMLMPFLLFLINKVFGLINTNELGNKILIVVNLCLCLTMVMVSNTSSATAISSEGNEFYLLKTAPSNTSQIAWAKILVNFLFSSVSIIASTVCIAVTSTATALDVAFMCFSFIVINASHILWSFELDLLNPQVKEYIATGATQDNKNANNSMALGVGMAFVCTFLFALMIFENYDTGWIKFLCLITAFLAARVYLFVRKLKLYFNDIEM